MMVETKSANSEATNGAADSKLASAILGMLAETSIHPGSGQSVSAIDQPVAREAATDYPFIAGSSLKGALRFDAKEHGLSGVSKIFGESDEAGDLLISDARLLLLPVRSLNSTYKWTTCPHLLERFKRDAARSQGNKPQDDQPFKGFEVEEGKVIAKGNGKLFLEERSFDIAAPNGNFTSLVDTLKKLIAHPDTQRRLVEQLAILSDKDFAWFARFGLAVQARNQLNEDKSSKNLWYEETLPADTLMYSVLSERKASTVDKVKTYFGERPYLQAGGNETVGQGWFALSWYEGGA